MGIFLKVTGQQVDKKAKGAFKNTFLFLKTNNLTEIPKIIILGISMGRN